MNYRKTNLFTYILFFLFILLFDLSVYSEKYFCKDVNDFLEKLNKKDVTEIELAPGIIINSNFYIVNPKNDIHIYSSKENKAKIFFGVKLFEPIKMKNPNDTWDTREAEVKFSNIDFVQKSNNRIFNVYPNMRILFENCNFSGSRNRTVSFLRNEGCSLYFKNCNFDGFLRGIINVHAKEKNIVFDNCTFKDVYTIIENYENDVNISFINSDYIGKSQNPLILMNRKLAKNKKIKFDTETVKNFDKSDNVMIVYPTKSLSNSEVILPYYTMINEFWKDYFELTKSLYIPKELILTLKEADFNIIKYNKFLEYSYEKSFTGDDYEKQDVRKILSFSVLNTVLEIFRITEFESLDDKDKIRNIYRIMDVFLKDFDGYMIIYPYYNNILKLLTESHMAINVTRNELYIDDFNIDMFFNVENEKIENFYDNMQKKLNDLDKNYIKWWKIYKKEVLPKLSFQYKDDKQYIKKLKLTHKKIEKVRESSNKLNRLLFNDFVICFVYSYINNRINVINTKEELLKLAELFKKVSINIEQRTELESTVGIGKFVAYQLKKKANSFK